MEREGFCGGGDWRREDGELFPFRPKEVPDEELTESSLFSLVVNWKGESPGERNPWWWIVVAGIQHSAGG